MGVGTLRTGLILPRRSIWEVICLGLLTKWTFPIYLLRNSIHVCWNPHSRDRFSETIDLRGHMPRFTLKINVFPSISWESPEMCVETVTTGFIFMTWWILGVICLRLLEKLMFSHLSLQKPHKCVLKPSEQGSFFQDSRFEGSHA